MKKGNKINVSDEDRQRRSDQMKTPEFQAAAKEGRRLSRLKVLEDREERKRKAREKFYTDRAERFGCRYGRRRSF